MEVAWRIVAFLHSVSRKGTSNPADSGDFNWIEETINNVDEDWFMQMPQ